MVVALSELVRWLFPKHDNIQIVFNAVVPIAAFFIRAAMADRHFGRGEQYRWQILLFFGTLFYLAFLDAVFIVNCFLNNQVKVNDWYALGIMYLIYLLLMSIALFPLRAGGVAIADDVGLDPLE